MMDTFNRKELVLLYVISVLLSYRFPVSLFLSKKLLLSRLFEVLLRLEQDILIVF